MGLVAVLAVVVVGATAAWGWGPRGGQSSDAPGGLVTAVAEATGMTVADVRDGMHSGKTFSEILAENGADADSVVAETLAWMEARLLEAVEDGRISEELAAERLESAEAHLLERLEQSAPLGPMWGYGKGSGGQGRGFGGRTEMPGKGYGHGHGMSRFTAAPATNS